MPAFPLPTLIRQLVETTTPPGFVQPGSLAPPMPCLPRQTGSLKAVKEKVLHPQYRMQHAKGFKKKKKAGLFVATHCSFVPPAVVAALLCLLKAALLYFLKASAESSKVRCQD